MAVESSGPDLIQVVALLGAGVVAGAAFKRFGLGSVLGYLIAGIAVGPFGLRVVTDASAILHVAERFTERNRLGRESGSDSWE